MPFKYDFRYASSQKLNQSESCNFVEPLSLHNLREHNTAFYRSVKNGKCVKDPVEIAQSV